jgi:cell division protein FtsN
MARNSCAIGWVLAASLAATGCFGAQAKTIPEAPPLDMPAPPPRNVEVSEPDMPAPLSLPGEPARTTPSRARPTPAQRTDPPKPAEAAKVEAALPAEPPKPIEEPPKQPPPPTTLQTTSAQREGELDRRIRGLLTQASGGLNRINYQALNSDARTQYDTAKRFVAQAEEALRAKNLVFANNLAEKAVQLSVQLVSR